MAKLVVEEVKEFGVLPVDTIVSVRVDGITEKEVNGKNGNEGWKKLDFKFVIEDIPDILRQSQEYDDIDGSPIWGSVSMRLTQHPDNKLRQWAEALLNMGDLGVGFELDTDMLIGRTARGVVSHYTRRDGTSTKHQIGALLPPAPLATSPLIAQPSVIQEQPVAQYATTAPAAAADPWGDEPPF